MPLATVQFYQALRISEAAGIHVEDLREFNTRLNARLRISKSVRYLPNKKGVIQDSFKNALSNNGAKESPLFPQSYLALKEILEATKIETGPIFLQANGELLTYRQIQFAYNQAFKKAGLSYSGTHIMRHGGARNVFNNSNGDFGVAQQILGNSDSKTVEVYAKRSTTALNKFVELAWKKHDAHKLQQSSITPKADPQKSTIE